MADLKKKVQDFASIASALPDNLQVVCFELLLKHHLGLDVAPTLQPPLPKPPEGQSADTNGDGENEDPPSPTEDDIAETDLHAKARHFLHQHSLSIDHVNNIFYKEDDKIQPLFEDLKTTRMSDGQVRIALLQAFSKALTTGNFEASVEAVRSEAKDRKFYDSANFSTTFRNNKDLFDFDEWGKSVKTVRLSTAGKKQLAEVIKELQ